MLSERERALRAKMEQRLRYEPQFTASTRSSATPPTSRWQRIERVFLILQSWVSLTFLLYLWLTFGVALAIASGLAVVVSVIGWLVSTRRR